MDQDPNQQHGESFDVVATPVAIPAGHASQSHPESNIVPEVDFWERHGLNKMYVVVGGIVAGTALFAGGTLVVMLLFISSLAAPQPTFNPGYGGNGIQALPGGGYVDQQGGFGSGTGMSSGTMDSSGQGNHVIGVDGEVLNLPY